MYFSFKRFKGCECSTFSDLSKIKRNNKKPIDWNYFFVIGAEGNNRFLSSPILLNKSQNRTAFSIQVNGDNVSEKYFVLKVHSILLHYYISLLQIPLAVSILEYRNQYFVNIYDDRCPFIEIDNKTNIDVFVAEADFTEFSKGLRPKKSIHDENFQWLHSVRAMTRLSYTPPSINECFPEKEYSNVHLIFGCANRKLTKCMKINDLITYPFLILPDHRPESNIQWSIPIENDKIGEKYLALPFYGDVKINLTRNLKTVKISLQHIDFVSSMFENSILVIY